MSSAKMQVTDAFILAAGLGTRMRPLTEKVPKPLITVAGKTLLDHAIDAADRAGLTNCVVNVHYLADQIEDHLSKRSKPCMTVSDEREELLDSGGGVAKGLPLLSGNAFVVMNADSFWIEGARENLPEMIAQFDPERMDMLLLLAPTTSAVGFAGRGDFFMSAEGHLARRGEAETAPFVYAGAIVMRREIIERVTERKFSLNRLFDEAIESGRLYGLRLDGIWLHVGTPEAIAEAETAIATSR